MSSSLVLKFSHLPKLPHADKALQTLQKIASLVKPIMRKHSWTLPLLSEFLPDNPNLLGLNVNSGQKILIRLRPHNARDTFYPIEDLVGTMLHELTHNVHGPHDSKFYAFLKVLNEEYDALVDSGYSGEGFLSDGKRMGGASHNLPIHIAKQKAAEAAEARAKKQKLMGGGRLGGKIEIGKSARQLAAEAAERRMKDEKTCGSNHSDVCQGEIIKAERDGIIDLASNDDDSFNEHIPSKSSSLKETIDLTTEESNLQTPKSTVSPIPKQSKASNVVGSDTWRCSTCTYDNHNILQRCEMCDTIRPINGWNCSKCGNIGIENRWWSCPECRNIKETS